MKNISLSMIFLWAINILSIITSTHASVNFVQITDPHLFELEHKHKESRNSLVYFYLSVEKANILNLKLEQKSNLGLDFILCTGDLGIEKLLEENFADEADTKNVFFKEGKKYKVSANTQKWAKALNSLATILQDSLVKVWLFVPGNNDIHEDIPDTICFYEKFLNDLQNHPLIRKAGLKIVDFRLEAKKPFLPSKQPGVYKKGNLVFIGWDNSFFKNNGVVDNFLDKNGKIKLKEETLEYKRIMKLSDTLKSCKAKYAYIFLHIPEVDDPWLATFDKDTADKKNPVYNRLQKARLKSPELSEKFYPYSAWFVPDYIRKEWENLITNKSFDIPEIKGIFTGHLHDKNKYTYMGFHWIKSHVYKTEILNKLFICPTVSAKNQMFHVSEEEYARGMQLVKINSKDGKVSRQIFWLN